MADSEQAWVQVRSIGLLVDSHKAVAIAGDIMEKERARVGSIHESTCEMTRAGICTCEPYLMLAAAQ